MKQYGKIALFSILTLVVVFGIIAYKSIPLSAANWPATNTISIHKAMGNGFSTVGNAYAIISPVANCDMYNSSGAVETTYASAAITFTADGQYTDEALATIPALPQTITDWEITFYENATPTAGDAAVIGPCRLDPHTGQTFTDTNPIKYNRVRITNQQTDAKDRRD